jgi:acetylornithine/N-succinyldiaminopimelate aminotransferase
VVPPLPENNTDWQELEKQLFMRTFARLPVTLVRGQGALVWDINDKEYLDFVGGWAVNSLGHCHPVVVNALTEQAKTLLHVSNQFYTIPQLQLAELLINNSCLDRIFYCNSGAEANEGAIKLVRKYGNCTLMVLTRLLPRTTHFTGEP